MKKAAGGCLKYFVAPSLVAGAVILLLLGGAAGVWTYRNLVSPEPWVAQTPELGKVRDSLFDRELKPVKAALAKKRTGKFHLKLSDAELSQLITLEFPPPLGQGRVEVKFDNEDRAQVRVSRSVKDRWINAEWEGKIGAEAGDFTVSSGRLKLGKKSCPGLLLVQLDHGLEHLFENDSSLGDRPWRITDLKIEHGRARVTLVTWPAAKTEAAAAGPGDAP